MKDKKVEYGLIDKNNKKKSRHSLELLFHAKYWYYERFDFGWDFSVNMEGRYRFSGELQDRRRVLSCAQTRLELVYTLSL